MQLMIANTDGRVLNWGIPPWSNELNLPANTLVEIPNDDLPNNPRDYRYVNDKFVLDPLPPSEAELIKTEFDTQFDAATARLTQIINNTTATAAQVRDATIDIARIVRRHITYTKNNS